jgi:hypothetical protein
MNFCPNCGTANREGSTFCNQCGARLTPELPPLVCPRCGAVNSGDAVHCEQCGLDLAHPDEEGAPPGAAESQGEEPAHENLPPWLDVLERPEPEPPVLRSTPERSGETADEPAAVRATEIDWTPNAIPIEPIVGVPYRAHERPALLPAGEQRQAAELFAAAAAEEVHASPREVPAPPAPYRLAVIGRWLIAFALLFAVAAPLIWPVGAFKVLTAVPAPVASAARAVEALGPGASVLVAFDYDAGTAGELDIIAESYLRQLLARGAHVLVVSTQPEGAMLGEVALQRVLPDFDGAVYGETVLNLGYVPGNEAAVRGLAMSLTDLAQVDFRQNRTLTRYAVLQGLAGARSVQLIVVLGRDMTAVQRWIEQVGHPYGVPIVAGVPALAEPLVEPYRAAGQLDGVVAGLGGAAAYERLQTRVGPASRSLAALRTGVWTVAGVLIVLNVAGLISRVRSSLQRRRGRREER